MWKWLGLTLGLIVVVGVSVFWFVCPCATVPGGPLAGDPVDREIGDWEFLNEVELCQMQISLPSGVPWSLNLNCMAAQGQAYVSCSYCADKIWSSAALENPRGILRAERMIYPVTLRRVLDGEELDTAWAARVAKLGLTPGTPRPDHWWSFHLRSRPN